MSDPARLFDDPNTSDALREAIDAGRAELPDEAQLESLAAKLGPLLGGPGGGGGPPADPSPAITSGASVAGKALGGLAIAAAGVTAVVLLATPDARPIDAPPTPPVAPEHEVVEVVPEGVDVPEGITLEEPTDEPAPRPSSPRFEIDPDAELALIQRAQTTLRTDAGGALTLAEAHRRRFGPGSFEQERELIAIEALSRLGRDAQARARATRFRAAWPRSAHLRRIDVILE